MSMSRALRCSPPRAASTSSSACTHASSLTAAATAPRAYSPPNSSEVEEDGLALGWLGLNPDVESVAIVGLLGPQRVTPVDRNALRHGRLVEADARREMAQQPAGEDVHRDVRRAR